MDNPTTKADLLPVTQEDMAALAAVVGRRNDGQINWPPSELPDAITILQMLARHRLASSGAAGSGIESAAINQNDAMRQEFALIGNLVSDLARVAGVDQANADGSWPDLAGRIQKIITALSPEARNGAGEALASELRDSFPVGDKIGVRLSADMFARILATLSEGSEHDR